MSKIFALAVLFAGCLVNAYCNGQGTPNGSGAWDSIPQLRSGEGSGTGFVVAVSDSQVEIWTAAHVSGATGNPIVVVWQDGTETNGVVARSRLGTPGTTGHDEAKIIADKPGSINVEPIPIGGDLGERFNGSFAGYGNESYLRETETLLTKNQGIEGRVQLVPAAIPGDSGGPVFDEAGNVVGVVVQRTMNRRMQPISTLIIPINRWTDWKD